MKTLAEETTEVLKGNRVETWMKEDSTPFVLLSPLEE